MGGQPNDLVFGFSEDMEALDVRGRATKAFNVGFM